MKTANGINPKIFQGYDVRGRYPEEMNEEVANLAGRSMAELLRGKLSKKKIIVGRDVRVSSGALKDAFIRGVLSSGVDVIDIGTVTTPMLYFAVNFFKCAGGAIITASHNPAEYNGVKMVRAGAEPIPPQEILRAMTKVGRAKTRRLYNGDIAQTEITQPYIDFLASHAKESVRHNFRVVADASNGAGGVILKSLFEKLGVSYFPLFFEPDGRFPNHSPNPLEKESQQAAKELIIHKGADFGVLLDADGDRVIFVDEAGAAVRSDAVLALLADNMLKKGNTVIGDVTMGKIVEEIAKAKSAKFKRVPTGHLNIKKEMRATKAILAGESSGHYYFKDFFGCDSALFTLVAVMNIFADSRRTFSSMLEQYQEYFHSREYNFHCEDRESAEKIIKKFGMKYKNGKHSKKDGLSVEYPEWWFNLRASNTEPVLRLNVESKSKTLLEEKAKELTALLDRLCNSSSPKTAL
jgi:phosphomannomutase